MSRTVVTFNGHDLTQDYYVSDLRNSLLPKTVETQDVPGSDGALFKGSHLGPRTITLTLTAMGSVIEDRQEAARTLAGWLNVDEPKPLAISIDGGIYYLAIPTSENDATRYMNATSFEVEFICPDPVAYGDDFEDAFFAPSELTFDVGGNYPTMPLITSGGGVYISSDDAIIRIALEDGTYLAYNPPYGGSGGEQERHYFQFDCAARIVRDEALGSRQWIQVPMLPDADWLVLKPGTHTLSVDGCVNCVLDTEFFVGFSERWL